MKNPQDGSLKPKNNFWVKVIAVIIVIAVVGAVIAIELPHLLPKKVSEQTLQTYPGPSGPVNSDHLLGGCVIAEANTTGLTTSDVQAMDQFVQYMLSPHVEFAGESATGFIPISSSNTSESITHFYTGSTQVDITYFTSVSPSDFSAYYKGVVSAFNAKYTNIKVTAVDETATSIVSDIESDVASGHVGPVVTSIDNLDVGILAYGSYNGHSYLMNINSTVSGGVQTLMPNNVIPSIVNLTNYEGKIFAGSIPFITEIINTPLVWIDQTALKAAGINQEPQNYTALLNDAKILDKKYGRGMINFQGHGGASTATELYQFFVQFGGNPVTFNSTNDVSAMYYIYNLSKYFSPEYKTSYWATYKGLAANKYTMMDYQWPGSVDTSTVGMNTTDLSGNNSVLNVSLKAISEGVFIRDPVPWIGEWQTLMDSAWTTIITSGHSQNYTTIASALATANSSMYSYLLSNYNYTVAQEYEQGMYKPIIV
ncbi:MAG: ABC transporter substrate-binding protein [Candidatus Thermoplasmatota archaeon]|nr:ABC transporter substrate-binding protein [Candidatus Thermoplasmatota archaeon]